MSPVRTGPRLEHLLALQRRLEHEIAAERRKLALEDRDAPGRTLPGATPEPVEQPSSRARTARATAAETAARLDRLGVNARQVKEWAITAGLLDEVKRGRVPGDLVAAYADAHTTEEGVTDDVPR